MNAKEPCTQCKKQTTYRLDGVAFCKQCQANPGFFLHKPATPMFHPALPATDLSKLPECWRPMWREMVPDTTTLVHTPGEEGDTRYVTDGQDRRYVYQGGRWTAFPSLGPTPSPYTHCIRCCTPAPPNCFESMCATCKAELADEPFVRKEYLAHAKPTPPPASPVAQIESKLAVPITIVDTDTRCLQVGLYADNNVLFEAHAKKRAAMYRLVINHGELPTTIAALQLLWQEGESARMRGVEADRDHAAHLAVMRMMEPSPGIKDGLDAGD